MKLTYFGTAAAEGIPGMFCNCRVCQNAKQVRGKEIKTRSQALVDDKILIDFPADTYLHILHGGLDLTGIHTLIVTHDHSDHFYPNDFWCREPGMAHNIDTSPLEVYLPKAAYDRGKTFMDRNMGTERVHLNLIRPFEPFTAEGYRFLPLAANHSAPATPVIYLIEKDDKTLFYANDTGIFPQATWDFLKTYDRHIDFLSLDCTGTFFKNWRDGHMSLDTNVETVDRLQNMGLCDARTQICVHHFSHNGGATHEELAQEAAKYGFMTSYDGLEVEF